MVMIICLIAVMIYEVVARRVFNAPTIWAIDITYMTNGTLFLIGGAYTLQKNAHVRIDFLSSRLPALHVASRPRDGRPQAGLARASTGDERTRAWAGRAWCSRTRHGRSRGFARPDPVGGAVRVDEGLRQKQLVSEAGRPVRGCAGHRGESGTPDGAHVPRHGAESAQGVCPGNAREHVDLGAGRIFCPHACRFAFSTRSICSSTSACSFP